VPKSLTALCPKAVRLLRPCPLVDTPLLRLATCGMLWGVAIVVELSGLGRVSREERFDAKLAVESFNVAVMAFKPVSRF